MAFKMRLNMDDLPQAFPKSLFNNADTIPYPNPNEDIKQNLIDKTSTILNQAIQMKKSIKMSINSEDSKELVCRNSNYFRKKLEFDEMIISNCQVSRIDEGIEIENFDHTQTKSNNHQKLNNDPTFNCPFVFKNIESLEDKENLDPEIKLTSFFHGKNIKQKNNNTTNEIMLTHGPNHIPFHALLPSKTFPKTDEDDDKSYPIEPRNIPNLPLLYGEPKELNMTYKSAKGNFISADTVHDLLTTKHNKRFLIIDCRFEFEYKGGHIKEAINVTSRELIYKLLFTNGEYLLYDDYLQALKTDPLYTKDNNINILINTLSQLPKTQNKCLTPPIIIFHCEFSQYRAPKIYTTLRNYDREINFNNYPCIYYPEMYILQGGYQQFHQSFSDLCVPNMGYTKMNDHNHNQEMEFSMSRYKRDWDYKKPKTFQEQSTQKMIDPMRFGKKTSDIF